MLLKNILEKHGKSPETAIVCNGEKYTYQCIHSKVLDFSKNFLADEENTNIGIFMDNSIDYIVAYFSIAYIDKVIVPFATDLKKEAMIQEIIYSEINTIITTSKHNKYLCEILSNENIKVRVINIDCEDKYILNAEYDFLPSQNKIGGSKEDDAALLLHTSGTTGNPKKVILTHKNLISNLKSINETISLNHKEKTLIVLPLYLSTANIQMLQHLYIGAVIHIYDKLFIPGPVLEYMLKNDITNTSVVPFMVKNLMRLYKRNKQRKSSLKCIYCTGGPLDSFYIREFISMIPDTDLIVMYGQTEASPRIAIMDKKNSDQKIGSVGKNILGVEIKIVDENAHQCAANKCGEIIIRGNNVTKGYYKNEIKTNEILKNGFLYTGDIGRIDDDGYLYIVGRKRNIIIVNGRNVYPEKVENILLQYPGVSEAIVYLKKDSVYSEQVFADVVIENSDFNLRDLVSFCKEKMSSYETPKEIKIVSEIKKTKTKKKVRA